MVVGHSVSGEMDKIDGPYYLFKPLQKLRDMLPHWVPLIGFEGGHVNLVPVDFVAQALAHLAHVPGQDGRCFHLTDPADRRVGEVLNVFAAAGARADHDAAARAEPAGGVAAACARREPRQLAPVGRILDQLLRDLGIPKPSSGCSTIRRALMQPVRKRLLARAGIGVPRLEDYAWRLWDYWERQLDPICSRRAICARPSRARLC